MASYEVEEVRKGWAPINGHHQTNRGRIGKEPVNVFIGKELHDDTIKLRP